MGGIGEKARRRLEQAYRSNRANWAAGTVPASELLYLQVFEAAAGRAGLALPPLYPVGNAANASLLYALLRLALDFPALDWLELGAGQSSLLLDALRRAGHLRSLLTLEHDAEWAQRIDERVAHPVQHAPLIEAEIFGATVQTYDFMPSQARFGAVLVDGPVGTPRRSRWGALDLLEKSLTGEFVVIFDDAERPGERATIEKFLELHPAASHVFVHAMKSQCLVFTDRYRAVSAY